MLTLVIPDCLTASITVAKAPQEDALLLVDADDHTLFGDFLHRARFGNGNLNSRLEHWSRHHKYDEQHKNDVHQRRDVDVGKSDLGAAVASGEGHYRRTSSGMRAIG